MPDEKRLVGRKRRRKKKKYLVRWKNIGIMEATWILEEALEYKGRPMTIEKEDQIREN